jgi:hypothetical protein
VLCRKEMALGDYLPMYAMLLLTTAVRTVPECDVVWLLSSCRLRELDRCAKMQQWHVHVAAAHEEDAAAMLVLEVADVCS